MLCHLHIVNFALLSDVDLTFSQGLNIFTGETGAGKSLIVEAVNLLRGTRANKDFPRKGCKEAVIEADFSLSSHERRFITPLLTDIIIDDDTLIIRRIITHTGRSRAYINGVLVPVSKLAILGTFLIDVSSQHQHQLLTEVSRHRDILDDFSNLLDERDTMKQMYQTWDEAQKNYKALTLSIQQTLDQLDYIRFQCEEIEAANLVEGELDELMLQRDKIKQADKLYTAIINSEHMLYTDKHSAFDRISSVQTSLERAASIDPQIETFQTQIKDVLVLLEDITHSLSAYKKKLAHNETWSLNDIEDRINLIRHLEHKHGGSIQQVLDRLTQWKMQLSQAEQQDAVEQDHKSLCETTHDAAEKQAKALTQARQKAAKILESNVTVALRLLAMTQASLSVSISPSPLSVSGHDHIEFLLITNSGDDPKPLIKIASGGELSRVMLALKQTLQKSHPVSTHVFDEVDAGIGGVTATAVGKQIQIISTYAQVLCVTHLPQIAAFADTHFHVKKSVVKKNTKTSVTSLTDKERIHEIVRMLGGQSTTIAQSHAQEMLKAAQQQKAS